MAYLICNFFKIPRFLLQYPIGRVAFHNGLVQIRLAKKYWFHLLSPLDMPGSWRYEHVKQICSWRDRTNIFEASCIRILCTVTHLYTLQLREPCNSHPWQLHNQTGWAQALPFSHLHSGGEGFESRAGHQPDLQALFLVSSGKHRESVSY
jgi:hypothetical protein